MPRRPGADLEADWAREEVDPVTTLPRFPRIPNGEQKKTPAARADICHPKERETAEVTFALSLNQNSGTSSSMDDQAPASQSRSHSQQKDNAAMSKLSPSLKALINAPFARPDATAAPARIRDVYKAIANDAAKHNVGVKPWLALTTATTFTLNSPDSLPILHGIAASSPGSNPVHAAEFIREVGLKCISFNGIPRSINNLNAFHASLPSDVKSQLATQPTRAPTEESLKTMTRRGRGLWDSVYAPFEDKLLEKLAASHPDLPVHILNSHYAPLLSDPEARGGLAKVGRVLTSVVAISCLRAQTGVGPQVLSHVFGLRKALDDGSYKAEAATEEGLEGVEWLAGDEGGEWMLKAVDSISEALGGGNFGAGKAKL